MGSPTKKHQYWFDEANKEIQELLEKKRSCHNHPLAKPDDEAVKAAYKTICCALQTKLRTIQNDWGSALDEKAQQYAYKGLAVSTAPTSAQWNNLLTQVASSPAMPQSAKILTTACPKPAVLLEDCHRECGIIIRSSSP